MNIENIISKRDVNYQICSTAIILDTAVSTLPWIIHASWNLSRFPFSICCCQRSLLPLIQKWFPSLCIPCLHAINCPLRSRGEGGYRDHPGFLTGYQAVYNQKKVSPTVQKSLSRTLPVSHHQVSLQLGFTVELFHAHSLRARCTNRSKPSIEALTNVWSLLCLVLMVELAREPTETDYFLLGLAIVQPLPESPLT